MLLRTSLDPIVGASILASILGMLAGWQALHPEPGALMPASQQPAMASPLPPAARFVSHEIGRAQDGMFYLSASANGRSIRFLVDTGASITVLTPSDASLLGVEHSAAGGEQVIATASGQARGTVAVIANLKIGATTLKRTRVIVLETGMSASLIGQDVLRMLGPITFNGDRMTLGNETKGISPLFDEAADLLP